MAAKKNKISTLFIIISEVKNSIVNNFIRMLSDMLLFMASNIHFGQMPANNFLEKLRYHFLSLLI